MARLARDPSYDGRFFTGVCTTGRLLRPNSLNFGLVFVVGLKPPRSPQPGRAPVRRLIGRCILSGIRREARGLEGDQECYRNRCAPLRGSHLTLRWREMDSNVRSRIDPPQRNTNRLPRRKITTGSKPWPISHETGRSYALPSRRLPMDKITRLDGRFRYLRAVSMGGVMQRSLRRHCHCTD